MPANLENSAVATELEKVSFHSNPKEGQCQRLFKLPAKDCANTIALTSHANKIMLKILQARLQQYMNHELPDVQAAFRINRLNVWTVKVSGHILLKPSLKDFEHYLACL